MTDKTLPETGNSNDDIQGFDDKPSAKCPKWAKVAGWTVGGLVVLAFGASFVASQMIDQQKYKKIIIEKVAEQTGYNVNWDGDISVSFLPLPHAGVNGLTVSVGERKILSVKSADVEVALLPLLSQKVEINDVSIDEPNINLVTLENGQQTWMTDLVKKKAEEKKSDETADKSDDKAGSAKTGALDIAVNMIEVTNGVIIWDDKSKGTIQKVEDVDLLLKARSLSGPFELNGGLVWNGKRIDTKVTTADLDMQSGLYPVQIKLALPDSNVHGQYSGTISAKDKVTAEGDLTLEITDLGKAIENITGKDNVSLPDELKGKSALTTKLDYAPEKLALEDLTVSVGQLAYSGNFAVKDLATEGKNPEVSFDLKSSQKSESASSPLIKFMDNLKISATGSLDGDKLVIKQSRINLNENDIAMSGTVAQGKKPTVDLNVNVTKLDLDQVQKKLRGDAASESSSISVDTGGAGKQSSLGISLPFSGSIRADVKELVTGGKTYTNINADISAVGDRLQINKFSAGLPQGASVQVSGSIGNTTDLSEMNLQVAAKAPNVEQLASDYNATLPALPKKIGDASLSGKITGSTKALGFDMTTGVWGFTANGVGTVATPLSKPVINQLRFDVKNPSFVNAMRIIQPDFQATSGFTGPMNLSGQISWGDDQYHITDLKGMFGQTSLAGTLDLGISPKPSVTGEIKIGDLVLPSSNPSSGKASASGAGASQAHSDKARWSREAIDTAWMKAFNADLKVTANSITQNLWRLTNANLEFALQNGTLKISDMSAGLFGGSAAISGKIQSGSADRDPLTIDGKMTATNVDAQRLASAAMGMNNDTLSGRINNVDVAISATGLSPAALVQTLSGKGDVTGSNIVVKGIDAAQLAMAAKGSYKPMERAGTLFGSFGDGQTEFTTLDSVFTIQSGIVNFSKIDMDGPKALLNSTGNVNLPQYTIDLKNKMTIKDTDIPPFEFTVKGPLDNPTKAGSAVIENYLKSKIQNKANKLIEKQLGKLLGGATKQEAPASGTVAPDSGSTSTTPATDTTTAPAPAPATQENPKPKDILKQEGLKALGGLLGQ